MLFWDVSFGYALTPPLPFSLVLTEHMLFLGKPLVLLLSLELYWLTVLCYYLRLLFSSCRCWHFLDS